MPREGTRSQRKPKYGPWAYNDGIDRADQYRLRRSSPRGSASSLKKLQKQFRIAGKSDAENPELVKWHQSHKSKRGKRP